MGQPRISMIGLGKMGAPMARRLLAAGYAVTGYDLRREVLETIRGDGADVGDSPAAVASRSDVVITMLPDGRAVEQAVYGEDGLAQAVRPGQILLEMTSSHPAVTRRIAADLGACGVRVLDAPVSGGVRGAEEGTLCVMAGGPADVLDACRPILNHLARDIVHVGDAPGDGDTAKTINNLLSATTIWSAMEGVVLGVKAGLAPDRLLAAVNRSSGCSYATETKFDRYILPRDFSAGFTVGQYLKDLTICLDLAGSLGAPMLLGTVVRQAWAIAAREGLAESDHTALITLLERWVGADLTPRR